METDETIKKDFCGWNAMHRIYRAASTVVRMTRKKAIPLLRQPFEFNLTYLSFILSFRFFSVFKDEPLFIHINFYCIIFSILISKTTSKI